MGDLLDDPRFPDRPTHPDFWRIVDTVLKKDGGIQEGQQSVEEVLAELVDVKSVDYVAMQRGENAVVGSGTLDLIARYRNNPAKLMEILVGALGGSWVDGFSSGVMFQKAGGHRPE